MQTRLSPLFLCAFLLVGASASAQESAERGEAYRGYLQGKLVLRRLPSQRRGASRLTTVDEEPPCAGRHRLL